MPVSEDRDQRLSEFVRWASQHVRGDEKSEAQIFLDRLFQGFGHGGVMEAGAKLEFRVKKTDNKGTAFADLVWKPRVLIEMKKAGQNLGNHYRQAFDYWTRLVPDRPRYVVLCNFQQFWVYDFETQMDIPVDRVDLADLPERFGPLAFLFKIPQNPVFGNDHETVTREAADKLALCFNHLTKERRVERKLAQHFILQTLVALFAEDIGLLDRYTVTRILDDCKNPADTYDLLGGLFQEMNTPGITAGGRFKGVGYFNGGLFAEPARLELVDAELRLLKDAANKFDWSKVRPEIFGTLFEDSLDADERHAYGAHFTSATDIMKIVGPTIVEPWREQIESANTLRELRQLQQRLQVYRVLDPACGSGNFLYIAYRELKRIESRLLERIGEFASTDPRQMSVSHVNSGNFFGIDIDPFAIEISKLTLMIGRKLAIDELQSKEDALPLDNLDRNFLAGDALLDNTLFDRTPWPGADVIIGNPPFLGAKRLKPERGPDYVNSIRQAYPSVPGMADYCVYWFRKAHDQLPECTAADPLRGRAGLVGTQNIRNNQSRVGGLDYILRTGTIVEAVDNQPWSGEANVHVSIVNWIKSTDPQLAPRKRRLWYKLDPPKGIKRLEKRGIGPAHKQYDLNYRECDFINSALSDQTDVSEARILKCNVEPQRVFQGQVPGHEAFVLQADEAVTFFNNSARNRQVIHPFLIGRDVLTGDGHPTRWVIDFHAMPLVEASSYSDPFKRIECSVLPDRRRKAEEGVSKGGDRRPHHQLFLRYWWRHSYDRPELISIIEKISRYIVCSGVTKRPIFTFVSSDVRPDHAVFVFCFDDDYSFGILQSHAHWLWFITKCSKLKSDFRYTPPTVFDTFPWPQSPTISDIEAIAHAGREIRRLRETALQRIKGGLRELYRTLELPGKDPLKEAHDELNAAVLRAYGFRSDEDLLAQLLALNEEVAERIDSGKSVVSPGIPPDYPDPDTLVTEDCVGSNLQSKSA